MMFVVVCASLVFRIWFSLLPGLLSTLRLKREEPTKELERNQTHREEPIKNLEKNQTHREEPIRNHISEMNL